MNKYIAWYLSSAIERTGSHHLFNNTYGGLGHILMFHRVLPQTSSFRIHNDKGLEISPEHLESIIRFLQKENYHFLSLDELPEFIKNNKLGNKFSVFTFDDGYFDNYQYALPIFEKYKVPFTVYVTTDLPDRKALLWWYFLEEVLIQSKKLKFTWKETKYEYSMHYNILKERAFMSLRRLMIDTEREEIPGLLRLIGGSDYQRYWDRMEALGMSWEQIREMAGNRLVTIGAHTITHRALSRLSAEEARHEIAGSKIIIENKIGRSVKHFSYPFGKRNLAGDRERNLVNECGFSSATTTLFGNIQPQHADHLLSLPRITVNSLVSTSVLNLSINGLIPAVRNRFKRLVV
ncbi:MAG: polysaccharide deacetylase family protein [Bacteroidales bacterium]|nr:polysaccharide deacetylase family protein [Bacteroidales bacterium]